MQATPTTTPGIIPAVPSATNPVVGTKTTSSGGYSPGIIAAIVVPVVLVVAAIIFVIVWFTMPKNISSGSLTSFASSSLPVHVFTVDNTNNQFVFFPKGAAATTATIANGNYAGPELAIALQTALNIKGTWTVSYNPTDKTFTISTVTTPWSLCPATSPVYPLIGFPTDKAQQLCEQSNTFVMSMVGNPTF